MIKRWFLSCRRTRCSSRTSKANWPNSKTPFSWRHFASLGESCTQHTFQFYHPKSSLNQGVSQEMEVIERNFQSDMAALNEEHKRHKEMISAIAACNKMCRDGMGPAPPPGKPPPNPLPSVYRPAPVPLALSFCMSTIAGKKCSCAPGRRGAGSLRRRARRGRVRVIAGQRRATMRHGRRHGRRHG